MPDILRLFYIILPDMAGYCLLTVPALRAQMSRLACFTLVTQTLIFPVALPIGRAVRQAFVFRADDDVQIFIIYIFIPFMKSFLRHRAFIRQGGEPSVIYDTLADPRGFISRIHGDCPDLGKPSGHFLIKRIKGNTVMYISACYYRVQYKVMPVTDCMGLIRKTMFMIPFPEHAALRISR